MRKMNKNEGEMLNKSQLFLKLRKISWNMFGFKFKYNLSLNKNQAPENSTTATKRKEESK